jgi:hypothetical protein
MAAFAAHSSSVMRHLAAAELWELYDERAIPGEEDFVVSTSDNRQVRCDVVFVCARVTPSRSFLPRNISIFRNSLIYGPEYRILSSQSANRLNSATHEAESTGNNSHFRFLQKDTVG